MASEDAVDTLRRVVTSYPAVVVAALLVGALLAPIGLQATEPDTVAVVPIEGGIDGNTAATVTEQLRKAENDPSVEAVVLLVNSPGGSAQASESLYLAVQRLAKKEGGPPVITSIDALGASGAYYAAAPSDFIFAKPSSVVGSVGVLSPRPPDLEPQRLVITTGPSKLTGGSDREISYRVATLQNAFVNAVVDGRGDRLELSRAEVGEAKIYAGTTATENGMVDAIGGLNRAVQKAAMEAGLDDYSVEVFRPNGTTTFITQTAYVASTAPNKRLTSPSYFTGFNSPGSSALSVLMLPPQVVYDSFQERSANSTTATPEVGDG